jgi:uncharacterized membrane protein (DUF106 family)
MQIPVITAFLDIFFISLIFAILTKIIQHIFVDPKQYFAIKKRTKELNLEQKKLMKEKKFEEVQKKQKESMELVTKQMSLTFKTLLPSLIVSLPVLYLINKYYNEFIIDFILFKVKGFWAFFIIIFIFSIIINSIYDKIIGKKYN